MKEEMNNEIESVELNAETMQEALSDIAKENTNDGAQFVQEAGLEQPEMTTTSSEPTQDTPIVIELPKTQPEGKIDPLNDSTKKDSQRNPNGTIKPGTILNPNGRPKGKMMSTLLKEHLKTLARTTSGEEITLAEAVIRKLTEKAVKGNDKSIEMLLDRIDGKPRETIDLNRVEITPEAEEAAERAIEDYLAHGR